MPWFVVQAVVAGFHLQDQRHQTGEALRLGGLIPHPWPALLDQHLGQHAGAEAGAGVGHPAAALGGGELAQLGKLLLGAAAMVAQAAELGADGVGTGPGGFDHGDAGLSGR